MIINAIIQHNIRDVGEQVDTCMRVRCRPVPSVFRKIL
jgi:hypothetical protein